MTNYIKLLTNFYIEKQFGGSDIKWSTLVHNGPMFFPLYIPHNVPLIYDGKAIILPPLAE